MKNNFQFSVFPTSSRLAGLRGASKFQKSKSSKRKNLLGPFVPFPSTGRWVLGLGSSGSSGFTLVELLAVMMVFGVVSGITGSILVTSLRTSQKSNTISQIRENGNFAISQIVKTFQSAKSLADPFPCYSGPTPTPVSVKSITFKDQYDTSLIYSCEDSSDTNPNYIASNGASLLNTNVVSIKKDSCYFTCSQASKSDYPTIGINFILQQAGSTTAQEQQGAIPFSTSVVFRNFNR